ncbi:Uncharacterised protein [Pandoraea sputorum]|uniref:Uncharacterized protein n=2 Tax=Pandoraea sputorum TaxID=93222 RepID=A0A239SWG9_9BURK|nr:Uncharacterised protein [Pandoraea sputorum]
MPSKAKTPRVYSPRGEAVNEVIYVSVTATEKSAIKAFARTTTGDREITTSFASRSLIAVALALRARDVKTFERLHATLAEDASCS